MKERWISVRGMRRGEADVWVVGRAGDDSGEIDLAWIWCVMSAAFAERAHELWRWESCWVDLRGSRVKSVLTSWITYSAGFMYRGIY